MERVNTHQQFPVVRVFNLVERCIYRKYRRWQHCWRRRYMLEPKQSSGNNDSTHGQNRDSTSPVENFVLRHTAIVSNVGRVVKVIRINLQGSSIVRFTVATTWIAAGLDNAVDLC